MFNRSFFSNLPPVTRNLLIINIIIWAFINITPDSTTNIVLNIGALHYFKSDGFGIWQLFTYMFIQKDFMHLFFNMWGLLMFGMLIEQALGSRRFIFYYITCGIGAALIQMGVYAIMIHNLASTMGHTEYAYVLENGWSIMKDGYNYTMPQMGELNALINAPTIGASGAIFGILLAVAMLYPNLPMYIMFIPVPVKAKWMVLGYGVIELFQGVMHTSDNVAHFAHLGGMIFGFFMLYYWKQQYKRNGMF